AGRNPRIAWKQVLVEVITAEADDCEMYALRALRTKRTGNDTGRKADRGRLSLCQLIQVINMPTRDDHTVAQVGPRVPLGRTKLGAIIWGRCRGSMGRRRGRSMSFSTKASIRAGRRRCWHSAPSGLHRSRVCSTWAVGMPRI